MGDLGGLGFDTGECMEAASLPPRKRLLAGLKKKQNAWGLCSSASGKSNSSSSSSSAASTVVNSPALANENPNLNPSIENPTLKSFIENPNLKPLAEKPILKPSISSKEIAEASRAAALAAAESATTAKRVAAEKATEAMKAKAAAKSALEIAAFALSKEQMDARGGFTVKSKPTKHVPIKLLYKGKAGEGVEREQGQKSSSSSSPNPSPVKKHEPIKISYKGKRIETKRAKAKALAVPSLLNDEELARELHRAINSSPRISKNLDLLHHSEKPMNYDCLPSPRKINRLRFAVGDVISDGKLLVAKVANLDKMAETVDNAIDGENCDFKEPMSEASVTDEENCELKPQKSEVSASDEENYEASNDIDVEQHDFDVRDANSENKARLKRKSTCLYSPQIEDMSKCARIHPQAENHRKNHLVEESKSLLISPARQSNTRHNSERRTKSISGDFPQRSELPMKTVATWPRDVPRPNKKLGVILNLSSAKSSVSSSRPTRRRT